MRWCGDFITSYVERYLPQLGITATPVQLCIQRVHEWLKAKEP